MNGSSVVAPVTSFPDTGEALLDYLVARTGETIGHRVDRADAILLGTTLSREVVESGAQAGDSPRLLIDVVTFSVEEALTGGADPASVRLVAPRTSVGTAGAPVPTLPAEGTRGLAFVRHLPDSEPYAADLPADSYVMVPDEDGLVADELVDGHGRDPTGTRDPGGGVADVLAAVRWYTSLPTDESRDDALAEAVQSPNPYVARHALRALGRGGGGAAITAIREAAASDAGDVRLRATLALWCAGESAAALEHLHRLLAPDRTRFLRTWGLSPSESSGMPILYGPDPTAARSD